MSFTSEAGISLSQGEPKGMEMEPEMPMLACRALSTHSANLETVWAGVRFKLARLWETLAETFSFTLVQPQATARSTPFRLAIRARYSTPSLR